MKILFSCKRSFDSLGRQATNVLRIADGRLIKYPISLHKIRTETSHQTRLTNKHELKVALSLSKFSKISAKQSAGRRQAILFSLFQKIKFKITMQIHCCVT